MTNRTRLYLLGTGGLVALTALMFGGCGGGGSGIVSVPGTPSSGAFGDYTSGPTGSLVFRVAWPTPTGRAIPENTARVDIEVTGEGLAQAVTSQIDRPNDRTKVDNLPAGQKGVTATARDASGSALAYGSASVVVEAGKEKDVTLTLQLIEQAGVAQARAMVQELRDSAVAVSGALSGEVINQAAVWTADLVPTFALTMQRLDFVSQMLGLDQSGGGGSVVTAVGPAQTGRVIGTVVDGAGQPVAGATVEVRGTNLTVMSAADGLFDIQSVPPGTQILDVTSNAGAFSATAIVQPNLTTNVGTISVGRSRQLWGPTGFPVWSIFDLPHGKYQAALHTEPWIWGGYYGFDLTKVGDTDENTWVVLGPEGDALLKGIELTVTRTPQTNNLHTDTGQLTVTSSGDAKLDYQANLQLKVDGQSRVTEMTLNGSFKDKYLPSGISIAGTFAGEPLGNESYKTASFTGSITSDKVSLSIESASVTFEPPAATPDIDGWTSFVKSAELKNFVFQTNGVEEPVKWTGNLSLPEMVLEDAQPGHGSYPKKGEWSGLYESTDLTFEGKTAFSWENPQRDLTELPAGTATIEGRLAVRNRPVFSTKLSLTATKAPGYAVAIDLTRGDKYLRGTLTGAATLKDGSVDITGWSLDLEDDQGLQVQFSGTSNTGSITDRIGTTLADILEDPDLGLLVVRYMDGTVESLAASTFDFEPRPTVGTVTGTVVDSDTNDPIADAWVSSGYDTASTDSQGQFQIQALAGSQTLSVGSPPWSYPSQYATTTAPATVAANAVVDVGTIQLTKTTP